MSSPQDISTPLEPHHLVNLLLILRQANMRYQRIADNMRHSVTSTQHARKRATHLGLRVNIEKAVNCPQRSVSVIPLPILDLTVSPTASTAPPILAPSPSPTQVESLENDRRPSPLRRRPALKCAIPATLPAPVFHQYRAVDPPRILTPSVAKGRGIPYRGPPSRFMTPIDGVPKIRIPSPSQRARSITISQTRDIEMPRRPLADVPVDEYENTWGLDSAYMDSTPGSSENSSCGPATPEDFPPITLRIKRKTVEMEVSEKRLKYDSEDWVQAHPSTHRRTIRFSSFRK